MKLHQLRARFRPGAPPLLVDEPAISPPERQWLIRPEMHSHSVSIFRTPDQPLKAGVDLPLVDFLNGESSAMRPIRVEMSKREWPPDVELVIQKDRDLRQALDIYSASANLPNPERPAAGGRHVFPLILVPERGVRVNIPRPAKAPFHPRTNTAASANIAYLQEAIQRAGWPPWTFLHAMDTWSPELGKGCARELILYTWDATNSVPFDEEKGAFFYGSVEHAIPAYPRAVLAVAEHALAQMGVGRGDL
jgi:hypothetical protein